MTEEQLQKFYDMAEPRSENAIRKAEERKMRREDKELLLKDLCSRLPYGVMCKFTDTFDGCEVDNVLQPDDISDMFRHRSHCDSRIHVKPYLRPMSSMTKEEYNEVGDLLKAEDPSLNLNEVMATIEIDWLNAHHFDYRGLIPKGLAIEVTEENNPYKE